MGSEKRGGVCGNRETASEKVGQRVYRRKKEGGRRGRLGKSGVGRRGGAALWKFGRFGRLAFFRVAVLGERRMIGLRWFEAHDCRRPAAAGQRDAFCREITRRGRLGRVGGTGDNR